MAGLLYILGTNAGMSPEEVSIGSTCWSCVSDKWAALLFLLANGGGGGSSGTGCVLPTSGDPEGVLVSPCSPALAIDPGTSAIYIFTGTAGTNTGWALKI